MEEERIKQKCAFCGKETNFYFKELDCFICVKCLAEYKGMKERQMWEIKRRITTPQTEYQTFLK